MKDAAKPAANGGPKVRTAPWPARGLIGPEEKAAVDALFDEAIRTGRAPGSSGAVEEACCREFAASLGDGFADPGGAMPVPLRNGIPVVERRRALAAGIARRLEADVERLSRDTATHCAALQAESPPITPFCRAAPHAGTWFRAARLRHERPAVLEPLVPRRPRPRLPLPERGAHHRAAVQPDRLRELGGPGSRRHGRDLPRGRQGACAVRRTR